MESLLNSRNIVDIKNTALKRCGETNKTNGREILSFLETDLKNCDIDKHIKKFVLEKAHEEWSNATFVTCSTQFTILKYIATGITNEEIGIDFDLIDSICAYYLELAKASDRNCLATAFHFDLMFFINYFYRYDKEHIEKTERLILYDLYAIKMCPQTLMNAMMPSIEKGLTICKSIDNIDGGIALANYALEVLDASSCTYQKCQRYLDKIKL